VQRSEFNTVDDGTEFDARFVVIDDLVPDVLRPVAKEIIEAGSYLYLMKTQGAGMHDFEIGSV
jgi:hypothetical protein